MSRKVKSCAGRSHGCEETFLGEDHVNDKGRCVVQGSTVSSVRASKLLEWPGRKEDEPNEKTISLGKDPGVLGKGKGRINKMRGKQ